MKLSLLFLLCLPSLSLFAPEDFNVHIKNTGAQDIFFNVECVASSMLSSSIVAEVSAGGEIIKPISTSNTNHYILKPGVMVRISLKPYCNDYGIKMRIFGAMVGDLELNLFACPNENFSEGHAIEVSWDGTRLVHNGVAHDRTNQPCKQVVGSMINKAT